MQSKTFDNKSKYLLMVEDTASVAALYRSYLTPLEIDINIVGTGKEAIDFLAKWQQVTVWALEDTGAAKVSPKKLGISRP